MLASTEDRNSIIRISNIQIRKKQVKYPNPDYLLSFLPLVLDQDQSIFIYLEHQFIFLTVLQ